MGSPKTPWRDVASEVAARSRHVMLEAARASQRHEESVAKALDATRTERFAAMRAAELAGTIKEAEAKRKAQEQQEEDWLQRQRNLAAAKAAMRSDNTEDKLRARRELEAATLAFQKEREARVAQRKLVFAAAKERAEKTKEERARQRAQELADDASDRTAREEVRQLDSAIESARRKHVVYEEAVEKLTPIAITHERLQTKADLIKAELPADKELPAALAAELERAARRHETMENRVQDLKQEAERAAKAAMAMRTKHLKAAETPPPKGPK